MRKFVSASYRNDSRWSDLPHDIAKRDFIENLWRNALKHKYTV